MDAVEIQVGDPVAIWRPGNRRSDSEARGELGRGSGRRIGNEKLGAVDGRQAGGRRVPRPRIRLGWSLSSTGRP